MDEVFENRSHTNTICRLCIKTLILEYAVSIFENKDNAFDIHELIVKYLQLELSADDPISAMICQDCFDHLEDFHRFYRNVEEKQKILESRTSFDFLEVKCEGLDDKDVDRKDEILVKDNLSETHSIEQKDFLSTNNDSSIENEDVELISQIKTEENGQSSEDDTPLTELFNIQNFKQTEYSVEEIGKTSLKKKSKLKKRKKSKDVIEKPKIQPIEQNLVLEDSELNCEICQTAVGNYTELTVHFRKQHRFKKIYIKCCGKIYTEKKMIGRHLHRHRDPDKFKCNFCGKQFASTRYLKAHIENKHDPEKNSESLKCNICEKDFTLKKCFEKHMQYHKNGLIKIKETVNCDQCTRSFSSETRLKQHRKIMHGIILPYSCEACSENFLTKVEEENHRNVCKNRKLAQKVSNNQSSKKDLMEEFICKICCKIFPSASGLRAHISTIHENIHNFVCDQCGKKFKLKTSFKKHLLIHQGIVEPPAQCKTCGKWLKSQENLRIHQYVHDNSFNKCSLCEHVSTTRRALKKHVKIVHRTEHNFHCQYCEKSFKARIYLEEHMAIHTGVQLYVCPHCSKESRSRSNMYAHIKRMHHEEWLKKQLSRAHDPNSLQTHNIKLIN